MKKLSLNQMETINGGTDSLCYWALAGILVLGLSSAVVTGGFSLLLFSVGAVTGVGGMITSFGY